MMLRLWLLLCGLGSLSASMEEFFKEVPPGRGSSPVPSIDQIYLINLDKRKDRLASARSQLEKFHILPHRFPAVNGSAVVAEGFNDPRCNGMRAGEIGCLLSHLSVLQDAYDKNYNCIWILEDDFLIKKDPKILNSLISRLDKLVGADNWDILTTDNPLSNSRALSTSISNWTNLPDRENPAVPYSLRAIRKQISKDFIQTGFRARTHSMIIRRSAFKKILDYFKYQEVPSFYPYDVEMSFIPGLKQYMLSYPLVTWKDDRDTDVQKTERIQLSSKP